MKRIPDHIAENQLLTSTWRNVETIGRSQGASPTKGPIAFEPSGPKELQEIERLVRAGGAQIHHRGNGVIEVTLAYDGDDESQNDPKFRRVTIKPDIHA